MKLASNHSCCIFFPEPVPTESPFGRCPDGFQDFGHDQHCFVAQGIENPYTGWSDANLGCLTLGGHLVSIHSEQVSSGFKLRLSESCYLPWLCYRNQ